MKKHIFIACILSALSLTSCAEFLEEDSSDAPSGGSSGEVSDVSSEEIPDVTTDKNKIVDDDKVIPTKLNTNFDYNDMIGLNHNEEGFNGERYYLNNFNDYSTASGSPESNRFPFMGDPQIFYDDDGTFYITGTDDRNAGKVLTIYSSKDLKTFTRHNQVDADNKDSSMWSDPGNHSIFAAEMYKFNGKYYLYYSDNRKSDGKRYISVATSNNPTGPYSEYNKSAPTFNHTLCSIADVANYGILDQTIFKDDDGQMYMYFSSYISGIEQRIYGVRMTSPTAVDWSTCRLLSRPGYRTVNDSSASLSWECWPPTVSGGFEVNEAPYMMKLGGKYYLTYVVNHNTQRYYTACYATATSPLGNFVKPYTSGKLWTNLLYGVAGEKEPAAGGSSAYKTYKIWNNYMAGAGHHSITKVGDEYLVASHAFINYDHYDAAKIRGIVFDRLTVDNNGLLVPGVPTRSIQPQFSAVSGVKNIAGEAKMVYTNNVTNANYLTDGRFTNFPFTSSDNILSSSQLDMEAGVAKGEAYIKFTFENKRKITGLFIYNTGSYDTVANDPIKFVNFKHGNVIKDLEFDVETYIDDSKGFVFPGSAYHVDLPEGVETDQIVIALNNKHSVNLSEIMILGEANA